MKAPLFTVCLVLAGCGAKPDHPQVRVALAATGLQTTQMPMVLADSLGYFKAEGVDVSLVNLSSYAKTMEALLGGSVEVAGAAYQQAIQLAAEGQHVRAFFIGVQRDSRVLILAPASNEKFHRVEDLKGAVVGVSSPGSSNHQWVNFTLAAHGVRAADVSAVGIGVGASAVAALESGRIDAAGLAAGDHFRLLQRHPGLRVLVDSSTPEGMHASYGGDVYAGGALTAKQEWLDRNPDAARRMGRALQQALRWIAAHKPEEIRERLPESFRSQDAALDCRIIAWGLPGFTVDGKMPKGAPEAMKRFLDATSEKVRDTRIDLAATWTNDFL